MIVILRFCIISLSAQLGQSLRTVAGAKTGTVSAAMRNKILEARRKAVLAHNLMGTSLWTAELNDFSDKTDVERNSFRGYRSFSGPSSQPYVGMQAFSFLQIKSAEDAVLSAQTVDRRKDLKSSQFVRMQGECGSCWAIAAIGALEMRLEMEHGNATQLSWEELADCVPNPQQCGGDGGCTGATAELAFEYVSIHGIASADDYSEDLADTGEPNPCRHDVRKTMKVQKYVQLPANQARPLLRAVANEGPVVSAVDSRGWFEYGYGIYDSCPRNAVVDHAILIVGYGREDTFKGEKLYWLIRNSWSTDWGEEGYIRLLRHPENVAYCGTDDEPRKGSGCNGGPSEVEVCGMCGILSDNAYPVATQLVA